MENSKTILILGMHRSGTSCMAGTLEQAGLYLGNDVCQHLETNKKGTRENFLISRLNEKILNYNKGSWDNPPGDIQWTRAHYQEALSIIVDIEKTCESGYWGFKDPRSLITLPFWKTLIPEFHLIGTIRNPVDVAKSLNRRNPEFSIRKGMELWFKYNNRLLSILRRNSFPLVSFDDKGDIYKNNLNIIAGTFFPDLRLNSGISFFDDMLRTSTNQIDEQNIPDHVLKCYKSLQKYLM